MATKSSVFVAVRVFASGIAVHGPLEYALHFQYFVNFKKLRLFPCRCTSDPLNSIAETHYSPT